MWAEVEAACSAAAEQCTLCRFYFSIAGFKKDQQLQLCISNLNPQVTNGEGGRNEGWGGCQERWGGGHEEWGFGHEGVGRGNSC